MPYLTLTLSGYPVDLPADAQVALSYRANDLRNLDSREAAFSETFTLPLTARNQAVLGNPHSLDSLTTTPYRLLPAVLTSPGGVDILNGFALLELSHDGYDVTLTSALGGLFALVGDKKLRDLDLSTYDHVLNFDTTLAAEAHDYTQGYASALADDGRLTLRDGQSGILFYETRLAVFYHTLLTAIVHGVLPDWKPSGTLLAEDVYQRAVLPQATAYRQLPPAVLANAQASGTNDITHTYVGLGPQGQELVAAQFPVTTDSGGHFFAGTYFTSPPYYCDLTVKVRLRTAFRRVPGSNMTALIGYAILRDATNEQDVVALSQGQIAIGQSGVYDAHRIFSHELTDAFSAPAYTEYSVTVERLAPSTTLCLLLPRFVNLESRLLPGSTISWTVDGRVYPGAPVGLTGSLPDISQADFLKLVFNQFNIIAQPDEVTRRIRFDLFNDLERQRGQAVDWTAKIDWTKRPRLAYRLDGYAQFNTLAYDNAPDDYDQLGSLPPVPTGSAKLAVVDATLPAEAEAYAAPVFLPQLNTALNGPFALAWLPFFGRPDEWANEPERWNATKTYGDSEQLVVYGDVVWKGRALVAGTVPGSSRAVQDGVWQPLKWDSKNDNLASVTLLTPIGATLDYVPASEDAPSIRAYNATRRFVRDGLPFGALVPAYYPGLVNILQRVQVLTLDVRLTALDIADLDFTIPKRVDVPHAQGYGQLSALLYLNDIDQYQPSEPGAVACTFLVLGTPVAGLAPAVPNPPALSRRILATEVPQLLATENGVLLLASY